jgi:hypothetical protein
VPKTLQFCVWKRPALPAASARPAPLTAQQQFRQLGDIRRDPPRLIACQLGRYVRFTPKSGHR